MRVSPDPRIGTRLLGYRIESLLGRGGMSLVYRAFDEMLERNVALKFIAPELAGDDEFRDRFLRESRLAAAIEHPNIVPVYDAGEADGQLYIAMRYVEGTDLKRLLRDEDALPTGRALAIVAQAAAALDAAHARKLVHRDVKPSNILIADGDQVYLADFGLTKKSSDRTALSRTGRFLGTIDYVAPEQIEGKAVDARADVYALGCVLHECLTGEVPFARDSDLAVLWAHVNDPPPKASERRPELPAAIDAVVARALAKEPEERYATCAELVQAAHAALERSPERRARRGLIGGAVALLAAAVAIAAFLLARGGDGVSPLTTVDSLARVDAVTGRLVAAIELQPGANAVAFSRGDAWVTSYSEQTAFQIDGDTNAVVAKSTWGDPSDTRNSPTAIAAAGGTKWIGLDCCRVIGIDVYGAPEELELVRSRTTTFAGAGAATAAAFGQGAVWIATADGRLWRIDPFAYPPAVAASIELSAPTSDVVAGSGAVWVSVTNGSLLRVDPATNRIARTLRLRFVPTSLAIGFGSLWVLDVRNRALHRLVLETGAPVQTIPLRSTPVDVAAGGGGVWVSNGDEGTISRIDPARGKVVATTKVGPRADDLAVGGGSVWAIAHPR